MLHYKVMPCPRFLALAFLTALTFRQVLIRQVTFFVKTSDLGTNETVPSVVFVARKPCWRL